MSAEYKDSFMDIAFTLFSCHNPRWLSLKVHVFLLKFYDIWQ